MTSVCLAENSIRINGKTYHILKGRKKSKYFFDGVTYDNEEEVLIARMLYEMGIPFLHHVEFEFRTIGNGNKRAIWCPDFVFGRPFRWTGQKCNGSVIIGLEVKRSHVKGKPLSKSRSLLADKGIPILLTDRETVLNYFRSKKRLPLKPVKTACIA